MIGQRTARNALYAVKIVMMVTTGAKIARSVRVVEKLGKMRMIGVGVPPRVPGAEESALFMKQYMPAKEMS
jgi:hypothetical protein